MFNELPTLNRVLIIVKKFDKKIWNLIILDIVGLVLIIGGWLHLIYGINYQPLPVVAAFEPTESEGVFLRGEIGKIWVDVSGAVQRPGVYELEIGARVAQLIYQAGGFSSQADTGYVAEKLNLSTKLTDGEKFFIPFLEEKSLTTSAEPHASLSKTVGGAVSINSATLDELDALPGIGEKRAQTIIDHRPYTDVNQLLSNEVVTEGIFNDIKNIITL
ncbi:MAG TPA: SLBB domain-containing protein [Vitreimonas sp.]|nr:SLBB domain-containing protein [Vitreimonas sp.]